jgi:hypothetical protein
MAVTNAVASHSFRMELIKLIQQEDGLRTTRAPQIVSLATMLSSALPLLTGCGGGNSMSYQAMNPPPAMITVSGTAYGGQKLLKQAAVVLYSAGTGGYGAAPTMLGKTTTDDSGAWTVQLTKPASDPLVYVVASGGDDGNGPNSAIALMSALGHLSKVSGSVTLNEVTTVASIYSLAQFLDPSTASAVGAPASNATGLANAFGTVANLVNLSSGAALTSPDAFTPIMNSVTNASEAPPGQLLNTLAELLGVCISSSGKSSAGCATLFSLTRTTSAGPSPADTRQAILGIALHPGDNVPQLFALSQTTSARFQPDLGSGAPNDFTMAINFTGGSLDAHAQPTGVALDAEGDVWITAQLCNCVLELSPQGSQAGPFVSHGTPPLDFRFGGGAAAVGTNPNNGQELLWTLNLANQSVHALDTHTGAFLQGGNGFAPQGIKAPVFLATDTLGNVWVANSLPQTNADGSTIIRLFELSPAAMNDYSLITEFDLSEPPPSVASLTPNFWLYPPFAKTNTKEFSSFM